MMKLRWILHAFICISFLPSIAHAVLNDADKAQIVTKGVMKNPGFENSKSAWTFSGSTLTIVSSGANLHSGRGTGAWDPTAASEFLRSSSVTIPNGLQSQNGFASCDLKTLATDTLFQVVDGSNNILASFTVAANTGFQTQGINFGFPSSGSIAVRLFSASNSVVVYVDDCYLGKALNINIDDQIMGPWITYALTIGATTTAPTKGAVDYDVAKYAVVGDMLYFRYDFKQNSAGVTGSGTYKFPLAPGYTINTSKITTNTLGGFVVGHGKYCPGAGNQLTNCVPLSVTPYDSTNLALSIQQGNLTSGEVFAGSGSTPLGNTNPGFSYFGFVPVNELSGNASVTSNNLPSFYSAFHDTTCDTWTTTSGTIGNFTDDASCALTSRNSVNIVVSQVGSVSPAISWTPSRTQYYYVCAHILHANSTADEVRFRLWDGTTTIAEQGINHSTANHTRQTALCGVYYASSVATKTLTVQGRTGSGTLTMGGSATKGNAIEWSIISIDMAFPAPFFTGNVISQSTGTDKICWAVVLASCTADPCTIARQNGCFTSINFAGTGSYSAAITAGVYSSAPACNVSTGGNETQIGTVTSTAVPYNTAGSGGAPANAGNHNIICVGPK